MWYNVRWSCSGRNELVPPKIPDGQVRLTGLLGGADTNSLQSTPTRLSQLRAQFSSRNQSLPHEDSSSHSNATHPNAPSTSTSTLRSLRSNTKNSSSGGQSLASLAQASIDRTGPRTSLTSLISKKQGQESRLMQNSSSRPSATTITIGKGAIRSTNLSALTNSTSKTTSIGKSRMDRTVTGQSKSSLLSLASGKSVTTLKSPVRLTPTSSSTQLSEPAGESIQPYLGPPVIAQPSPSSIAAPSNPLISPPSIFALSLFGESEDTQSEQFGNLTFDTFLLGENKEAFTFDTPSPDDVITQARDQARENASTSMHFSNSDVFVVLTTFLLT
jgi:hypothetical protein